ncbi:MAG: hypothetical protein CBB70_09115 [Planctomycetaceae bacterium TMED10]|nr:MAG: hypothetical protein CBB70_09115 [Planctomycetaceae bacterium TMED10]
MQYNLRFVKGHNVGRSVVVAENQRLVLGRSRETNVTFHDPLVSRQHCELSNSEGRLSLFDLKSWNGTYVNGKRILQQTNLQDGDRVAIGKNLFEVRSDNASKVKTGEKPFCPESSTQEGWRPEKGLSGSDHESSSRIKNSDVPSGGHSWSPNMVAGYHINGKLGEGSVGTVFSAIRISDKKKVALKIIDPTYISKESGAKRFYRAVNICKDITHPNVIRIYDAGDSEGVYFIAMEYIGGKEVGAIINQYGHVSVPTTLQIGIQITAALQYAYERSFVHRDIKPRNIMVNRRGIAKLVDFGLAKRLYRPMQSVITAPGEAVGTLAYMPPEQIDNAIKADHRSDIYSLGATMYHMLTGKHPFSEGTFAEFVSAIMERVPERVDSLSRSIPSDLADIIERAMHKDPDSRYQTPAHFCNDLRTLAVRFNCLGRSASSNSKTMRLHKNAPVST